MKKALIFLFVLALLSSCSNPYSVETKTDKLGYTYEVVKGDPQQVRIYKLQNGLTVYLAHMDDAPRIPVSYTHLGAVNIFKFYGILNDLFFGTRKKIQFSLIYIVYALSLIHI